jgi:shikimate kinase
MKPEDLLKRLKGSKYERPLIHDLSPKELDQYISEKLKEREPYYLKSKYVVDGSHPDVPGILQTIVAEET